MTEYTDVKGNTYPLIQRVLVRDGKQTYTEEELTAEVYKIFFPSNDGK